MEFQERLASFIEGANKIIAKAELFHPTQIRIRNPNTKYIALDNVEYDYNDKEMKGNGVPTSVFCFIASTEGTNKALGHFNEGDVFKPASYKVPAKHARGNIYDEHNGLNRVTWHGPAYLYMEDME